jgi:glucose/arabinose dehydrogenase
MSGKYNGFQLNRAEYKYSYWFLLTALFLAFLSLRQAGAATVPEGFADREIASGLVSPAAMTVLPDGRILVVQQDGVIRTIKNDVLQPTNFLAVQNVDTFAERGCLGIAADPNFAANHFIYIFCTITDGTTSANRIFRVIEANDVAVPGTEVRILTMPNVPSGVQWHMGGALRFGPDGKLYVAVGGHEDFSVDPPTSSFSQTFSTPFGKILRINPDGSAPPDNPYSGNPNVYPGIYAIGLRNPFAFDIRRSDGLIYINDVGAGSVEEINVGRPGANYGWPLFEGRTATAGFDNAVYEYPHPPPFPGGCAVTGGAFYEPQSMQFPESYASKYLYADFCSGTIALLDPASPVNPTVFASGIGSPVNLGVSPDGSLYYLARNQNAGETNAAKGTVNKIIYTGSQIPRISTNPQSQVVFLGDAVTLTVSAAGATGFQWQRNGVDIPGAVSSRYIIPATTLADNQASFVAIARNSFGDAASAPAVLTVTTNRTPQATITSPPEGFGFAPGDTLVFSGTGTDTEDGDLPASAFTWQVDFMHDTHVHPQMPLTSNITSGQVALSSAHAEQANTWYRITLTVRDSAGLTKTVVRDIHPHNQLSDMTPTGTPVNGQGPITLDGIPYQKGVAVFPNSDIRYRLDGQCTGRFVADIGVDDNAGTQQGVIFQVFLDGVKAFDSGIVRASDNRIPVTVDLAGKNEIRLVVSNAENGTPSVRSAWAGARVTGCPPLASQPTGGASIIPPVGGGGGGCTIGGDRRFDPVLPMMAICALAFVLWRRRGRRE